MSGDNWYGKSFEVISKELSALSGNNAADLRTDWYGATTSVHTSLEKLKTAHDKLDDDRFWVGSGPTAAQGSLRTTLVKQCGDDGLQQRTYKMSAALAQDAGTLQASSGVPSRHKLPDHPTDQQRQDATFALAQDASSTYTTPMDVDRPNMDGDTSTPAGNVTGQQSNSTGTSNNSSGGGGGQSTHNATPGKDTATKAAFDQGTSDGQGQGQGQGQGAGQGQGGASGSGGGSPSGTGGSGSGSGLGGLGTGSDRTGSGLPYGATTAAGYHPSPSGTGAGSGTATGAGPGALPRGGTGIPGPGAGSGVNPAGVGAAGVRGAAGVGGFGMGGLGGAHARGQREEDEDHEIPSILINADNGNELYGDLPKASPGVIGDWTEQERAEKQRREAEKRRYKSLGWDVDFGDEK